MAFSVRSLVLVPCSKTWNNLEQIAENCLPLCPICGIELNPEGHLRFDCPGCGNAIGVCEVSRNPAFFDGKVVSLRATVASGFEVFAIRSSDEDCGGMWLEYGEGGPTASTSIAVSRQPRAPVTVLKDRNFKRFQSLLSTEMHPRTRETMCMDCHRFEVSATMVGRVDYAGEQMGYGHMNPYKLQFELISVSDVTGKDLSSRYDSKEFSAEPIRLPTGYIEGRLISPDGKKYVNISIGATRADAENEFNSTGDADYR